MIAATPLLGRDSAPTVFLRMSLACPYSSCGSEEIAETTTDGEHHAIYIAGDKVVSATTVSDDDRTSGHAGFTCTDCSRPVSLPPGWTYQRS
ncbi:hypothetical protein B0I32_106322 [Nonomuraea fuscirosea]|uniref:Uncharacterized protein n=1 Tax=Nonomuraea fuscirosea TaxID=1291556 RepID=A0A2T0N2L6_9ACTN|nr:hypothetical protein [Nonomuraea fuscirosea]PRX66186.1 hypothetical protein B0I32_106322 [Nonomuraea fuscirosea]